MQQLSPFNRRSLLRAGGMTLSAAGFTALFGTAGAAYAAGSAVSQDVQLLNAAIALEHEGIAAYTIAAGSGLLQPAVVDIGVTFRGHHMQHRDELMAAVERLGGKPAPAKAEADYVKDLGVAGLKSQADVLRLALKLERGAANAYLGLIPALGSDFHQVAARMAGDEAYHAAILSQALGEPIPKSALMFGG